MKATNQLRCSLRARPAESEPHHSVPALEWAGTAAPGAGLAASRQGEREGGSACTAWFGLQVPAAGADGEGKALPALRAQLWELGREKQHRCALPPLT